jgi:hypothetical protein
MLLKKSNIKTEKNYDVKSVLNITDTLTIRIKGKNLLSMKPNLGPDINE